MTERDAFIPARRTELIAALRAEGGLAPQDEARFADLARLIGAVFHYEAYDRLEALKTLYAPLDPDASAAKRETDADAFSSFEKALIEALEDANFFEIPPENEASAKAARNLTGLAIKTSEAGIRCTRFFARGVRQTVVERKTWFGLRRKRIDAEVFSEVVVLVGFKSMKEISRDDRRAFSDARRGVRPAAALVKHFRNVAHAELLTLHPGAKPTMLARDQVMLAAPALVGGVPIALQIIPAVTVLFTVIAVYFGARGVIDNSQMQRAIAALSGIIAVGTFVMRQWMKYERQNLKYQKQLAETVYFRNVANNAGVLDGLMSAGEDQDVKEAVLGYWALLRAGKPMAKADVDATVEAVLKARLSLDVDFEIGDALGQLERLGLVTREGELYRAASIDEALAKLDAAWDGYFKFGVTPPASASAVS